NRVIALPPRPVKEAEIAAAGIAACRRSPARGSYARLSDVASRSAMFGRHPTTNARSRRFRTGMFVVLGAALFALTPTAALAHGVQEDAPSWSTLITGWELDPLFIVPAGAAIWAYLSAVKAVNKAHPAAPVPRKRVVY